MKITKSKVSIILTMLSGLIVLFSYGIAKSVNVSNSSSLGYLFAIIIEGPLLLVPFLLISAVILSIIEIISIMKHKSKGTLLAIISLILSVGASIGFYQLILSFIS